MPQKDGRELESSHGAPSPSQVTDESLKKKLVLRMAIHLELLGMRRGQPSPTTMARRAFGFEGRGWRVLQQLERMIIQESGKVTEMWQQYAPRAAGGTRLPK